ncbi:efflux RND transporter periplasmic adaptor subunit [Nannocystis sp. ILAH1]|uniref:efflux RND transporter periplasmic adaptor subunit n=1 Tax=Nannocystis sp. ILAH1 TaxID=2996789 RepID=UPI002271074B|nr:efflux RND transporter periplasmic adaptor subunit [Nannocystis sp. ILAH1]MCY0989353.1 efflux RND transporter periplasmic adaptor subunit [Nannocystis sp. ILAH1]
MSSLRRVRECALGWAAAASVLCALTFQPRDARAASAGGVSAPQAGVMLGGLGLGLGTLALQRRHDHRAAALACVALVGSLSGCEPTSAAAGRRPGAGDDTRSAARGNDTPNRVSLPASAMAYIRVEPATHAPEDLSIRAPGRVAFRDNSTARVDAPAAGRVRKLLVEVGAAVKAGDPLIELSSPQASALHLQRDQARLELQRAERALVRQEQMIKAGVGRELDRQAARADLEAARVADRHARRAVEMLGPSRSGSITVVAPIDGTVLRRQATIGAQVEPGGAPLLEIGDKTALWVVADVFEDDLLQIRPGTTVQLRFSAEPAPVPGRVVGVGALVDIGQRRAPVYVAIADEAVTTHKLSPGMFVRADIAGPAGAGVTLPKQAVLIKDGESATAYVEVDPGVFEARRVVVGHTAGDHAQVVSGVNPGERVAVAGALLLDQQSGAAL